MTAQKNSSAACSPSLSVWALTPLLFRVTKALQTYNYSKDLLLVIWQWRDLKTACLLTALTKKYPRKISGALNSLYLLNLLAHKTDLFFPELKVRYIWEMKSRTGVNVVQICLNARVPPISKKTLVNEDRHFSAYFAWIYSVNLLHFLLYFILFIWKGK